MISSTAKVDLTAILVNYNTRELIAPCLAALQASARAGGVSLQIVMVDNASRDGSVEYLREHHAGECELIVNTVNVGFGRANNQALALARGRLLLLLNTDAFVAADSIGRTTAYLDAHPDCALLGVRLVGRDGGLQPSCRYFPTPWNEFLVATGMQRFFPRTQMVDDMNWDHAAPRACDWVPGCYYLVRREMVDRVGLFDPRFFLYYEEIDHCRAVKSAGGEVVFFSDTTVVHIGGESAKSDSEITASGRQISALQIESGLLYFRKHHGTAGLCATVLLTTLADAILAAKWLWRRRGVPGLRAFWTHTATTWSLLHATGWGRRPTR
jgi:N-acetylglucosaminyl-diphospho-decaprenol L-rhamnosyltransferase